MQTTRRYPRPAEYEPRKTRLLADINEAMRAYPRLQCDLAEAILETLDQYPWRASGEITPSPAERVRLNRAAREVERRLNAAFNGGTA
jgi:hypothetical protein